MFLLSTLGQHTTSLAMQSHAHQSSQLCSRGLRREPFSRALGDHMVLQAAPQRATIWGATTPGAVVTTTFDGINRTATADENGTWRQQLPPTPASSLRSHLLLFSSSSGETTKLQDVLFGEVFVCGGQSNMEMAIPAATNSSAEALAANAYPHIRIFSVGHRTSSATPLLDLQTVWEPWQVASNTTIREDFGPGHTLFSTFSAVCWFFGRGVADALARRAGTPVPVGLISNNWGGTKLEVWTPPDAFGACGRAAEAAPMYNAMTCCTRRADGAGHPLGAPAPLMMGVRARGREGAGRGRGGAGGCPPAGDISPGRTCSPLPAPLHPPPAFAHSTGYQLGDSISPTGTKGRPTWRTPTSRPSPRPTPASSPG